MNNEVIKENITDEDILNFEITNDIPKKYKDYTAYYTIKNNEKIIKIFPFTFVKSLDSEKNKKIVDLILNNYHKQIKSCKNDHEKIITIIDMVRKIEILHPFLDSNARLFCMIVLNRELYRNELSQHLDERLSLLFQVDIRQLLKSYTALEKQKEIAKYILQKKANGTMNPEEQNTLSHIQKKIDELEKQIIEESIAIERNQNKNINFYLDF